MPGSKTLRSRPAWFRLRRRTVFPHHGRRTMASHSPVDPSSENGHGKPTIYADDLALPCHRAGELVELYQALMLDPSSWPEIDQEQRPNLT